MVVEAKIYQAKQRPEDKPLPLLAANIEQIRSSGAAFSRHAECLAKRFMPGPLTLILETPLGTRGFRIPDHSIIREVIQSYGKPIATTSANLSGNPPSIKRKKCRTKLGRVRFAYSRRWSLRQRARPARWYVFMVKPSTSSVKGLFHENRSKKV